ncbi:MAG: YsnF/AvaK domain-containing protein [Ktedonobacteraceae bacterium]|nr:YsnF/AvaK domain-containing protein [Ktedonobacteraceae bacterium]
MSQSRRTVIGVFDEGAMADQAVTALEGAGFNAGEINRHGHQGTGGGFLSGLKNLFGGDNADTTRTDDFTDLGLSNDEATYYDSEASAGHHIVSVRAPGREEEAMSILRANGAYNYGTRSGGSGLGSAATTTTGYGNTTTATTGTGNAIDYDVNDPARTRTSDATTYDDATVDRTRTGNAADYADTDEARRLRLREEQLNVSKERVQSGEVGIHKDVISEEKTINVPVTHEEAFIERRPVTDASITDDTPIGEGETIRVPLSEEQVNVNKSTVVTGEVEIGKRAVTENQRVSDTVRREEARLERDGNTRITGDTNLTGTTEADRLSQSEADRLRTDRTDDRNL